MYPATLGMNYTRLVIAVNPLSKDSLGIGGEVSRFWGVRGGVHPHAHLFFGLFPLWAE